jgi:hypothetical protein
VIAENFGASGKDLIEQSFDKLGTGNALMPSDITTDAADLMT